LSGEDARKLIAEREARRDQWGAWSFRPRRAPADGLQPGIAFGK
jgi:hypothetical protein